MRGGVDILPLGWERVARALLPALSPDQVADLLVPIAAHVCPDWPGARAAMGWGLARAGRGDDLLRVFQAEDPVGAVAALIAEGGETALSQVRACEVPRARTGAAELARKKEMPRRGRSALSCGEGGRAAARAAGWRPRRSATITTSGSSR